MADLTPEQRARFAQAMTPKRTVVETELLGIDPRPMRYLWRPYLPMGKVVLVAGAPGHGKSQLTALFAALTTRALFYPSDLNEPGRVVVVSAEDDLADTVVPRLLAVNADIRLVSTIRAHVEFVGGLTTDGLIQLPGDVDALHRRLKRHPDTRLMILDPVVSFFGRDHSSLSNQDVRAILDPLKAMADLYGVTIVIILHLNKAAEVKEFASRIAESHGFQAVARVVLALGPDPEDPEGEAGSSKVLALTKANLIKRVGTSLRLEIVGATVRDTAGNPVETSALQIVGSCEIAADDLLMTEDQRRGAREAREWLLDFLGDEWRKVGDVRAAAIKEGHGWRTIERARGNITKTAKQHGIQHGPWWMAATTTPPLGPVTGVLGGVDPQDRQDNPYPGQGTGGGHGPHGQDSQDRQSVIDLDAHRRNWEIRNPGERWDDE